MAFRISPGSACALGTFLLIFTCRGAVAAETFVFHHEDVLGTSMELRLAADSDELARRAEELAQVYPADREAEAVADLTALLTALAMNHVARGMFLA